MMPPPGPMSPTTHVPPSAQVSAVALTTFSLATCATGMPTTSNAAAKSHLANLWGCFFESEGFASCSDARRTDASELFKAASYSGSVLLL
jgi:hypothetical protein